MKSAIFLLLPASVLLYYPLFLEEFERPKAAALVTFGCFAAFHVNWREVFRDRVAFCLVLFTLSAAISTVTSIDWHMSVFGNPKCQCGLLVITSYLIFYLAAVRVFRDYFNAMKAIQLVIALSFVVSAYAICQVVGIDFKQWNGMLQANGYVRPMSFLGHPNFMAGYLAMILPFALWRTERASSRIERYLCFVTAMVSVATIFFSQSRGMWIATIFGVASYFVLTKTSLKKAAKFAFLTAAIVSASVAVSPGLRATALDRAHYVITPGSARLEYWWGALRVWKRYPMLGIGTDAFELGFQHQRTPYYWEIEKSGSPHKAHNDFLNVLATQGALGGLTLILLTIAVILQARASVSAFSAPAIAAIIAFYVETISSFTVISTGTMFMLCLALLKGKKT